MAIEMPTPVTDRLSHPEWGPGPAPERRALAAGALLDALDAAGAPPGLLAPLRAGAQAGAWVELLLSSDRSQVLLLVDGRRIPLTGAARDAVLALLERGAEPAQAPPAAVATEAVRPDTDLAARVAAVDAELREAREAGPTTPGAAAAGGDEAAALRFAAALLRGDPGAAAARLAQTVEHSGLFLESHAAQWLRGERDPAQLAAELRALAEAGAAGTAPRSQEQRAALQAEALQRQALHLSGPAWPGQPMDLRIERERGQGQEGAGGPQAAGLFQATLALELPHLGTLHARIRVLDRTVGVQIEASHAGALVPSLGALGEALAAHGLSLIELHLAATPAEAR